MKDKVLNDFLEEGSLGLRPDRRASLLLSEGLDLKLEEDGVLMVENE